MATQKTNPFTQLRISKENMRNSVQWFQGEIKKLKRSSYQSKTLLGAKNYMTRFPVIGRMYLFAYDPKYAEELPYYDELPVIFMVDNKWMGKTEPGFSGINLHYIDPNMRLKLLNALYNVTNNDRFDVTTKLKITYEILVRLSDAQNLGVRNCYKNYLNSHVMSDGFIEIPPTAWPMVACLPIEQFQKQSKQYVWNQSKRNR